MWGEFLEYAKIDEFLTDLTNLCNKYGLWIRSRDPYGEIELVSAKARQTPISFSHDRMEYEADENPDENKVGQTSLIYDYETRISESDEFPSLWEEGGDIK